MHPDPAQLEDRLDARVWEAVGNEVFDSMLAFDRDGEVVWRWRAVGDPAGASPASTGHRALARVHPEDLPRLLEELRQVREVPGHRGHLTIRIEIDGSPDEWAVHEVIAIVLERDDDGSSRSVLICSTEVDQRELDLRDHAGAGYSFAAAAPIGLGLWTGLDRLAWCNDAFSDLTSLVAGAHDQPAGPLDGPGREMLAGLAATAKTTGSAVAEHRLLGRHVRLRAQPLAPGDRADVVVSAEDVSAEVDERRARSRIAGTFEATFEQVPVGLALLELDGSFRRVNPAWSAVTGWSLDELADDDLRSLVHPDDLAAHPGLTPDEDDEPGQPHLEEVRLRCRNGGWTWVELRVSLVHEDDAGTHFVASVVDVTSRRSHVEQLLAATDELEHRATHDHLTGLPNRSVLAEHLSRAARQAGAIGTATEVLLCDVDHLKPINDTHGHLAGDAVLVAIGTRLSELCRHADLVARFGGDEFVVIARALPDGSDADQLAMRLIEAVRAPVLHDGVELRVTMSIGIAEVLPGDTPAEILGRADLAAYEAKAYRNCHRRAPVDPRTRPTRP